MTTMAVALGAAALVGSPRARRLGTGPRAMTVGLASGVALVAVFRAGDAPVRRLVPGATAGLAEIAELQRLGSARDLVARLVVIGAAEELFWRGLVQPAAAARYGTWTGAAVATAAYALAHLGTANVALLGAATGAGGAWSAMAAAGAPMSALIVSHVTWDLWMFLAQPLPNLVAPAGSDDATGSRRTVL